MQSLTFEHSGIIRVTLVSLGFIVYWLFFYTFYVDWCARTPVDCNKDRQTLMLPPTLEMTFVKHLFVPLNHLVYQ